MSDNPNFRTREIVKDATGKPAATMGQSPLRDPISKVDVRGRLPGGPTPGGTGLVQWTEQHAGGGESSRVGQVWANEGHGYSSVRPATPSHPNELVSVHNRNLSPAQFGGADFGKS